MFHVNFGIMEPPTLVKLKTLQLVYPDISKESLHLRLLLGKHGLFTITSISVSTIGLSLEIMQYTEHHISVDGLVFHTELVN